MSQNFNGSFSKIQLGEENKHDSIFRKSPKSSFADDIQNCSKKNLKICSKSVFFTSGDGDIGERRMGELREECNRLKAEKESLETIL